MPNFVRNAGVLQKILQEISRVFFRTQCAFKLPLLILLLTLTVQHTAVRFFIINALLVMMMINWCWKQRHASP